MQNFGESHLILMELEEKKNTEEYYTQGKFTERRPTQEFPQQRLLRVKDNKTQFLLICKYFWKIMVSALKIFDFE